MGKADAGFEMTVVPGPHFSFSAFQFFSIYSTMPLQLDIVTPEKKAFSAPVDHVYLPGADGELGVLPMHAGLVTALKPGELRYLHNGQTTTLAIGSGFAEITQEIACPHAHGH